MRLPAVIGALALGVAAFVMAPTAATAALLGTPSLDPSFGARDCGSCGVSTNELNYLQQTPGHIGLGTPYVEEIAAGPGTITLFFSNFAPGIAFFEHRVDYAQAGTDAHPIVIGDTIHPGTFVGHDATVTRTFDLAAGGILDIRLALGGERDWDFDWTSFDVQAVPLPAALPLLLAGLGALGAVGAARRRRA